MRRLSVRNDYGDIRVRLAGDGQFSAHAVLQRLGGDPDVGVNVERHGDVLAMTVVSPPGRVSVSAAHLPKTAVDRVDLVVYAPKACALSAESLRGLVEVRGLEGELSLVTLDGEIRAVAGGGLRASSAGGPITALLGGESRAPVLIESRSGPVRLTLPAAGDYRLQVETTGALQSDLVLTGLEKDPKPGTRRNGSLQVGQGTRPIVVRSESGALVLVRP